MTKYLFLDIDYTLYSPKAGCVPPSALEAIAEARRNGHKVFLCTGRSLAEAADYLRFPVDGFVFASGAMCYAEGHRVYDHPIDPARINEVTDLIRSPNMGVLIGGSAGAYLDEQCYEELSGYLSGGEADPKKRKAIMFANGMFTEKQRHPKDPIYKLGASLPHGGSFAELEKRLPAPFKLIVTVTSADGDFAEITDSSITKSSGIREILKVYGADMKDAVGIGDSGNDVDMIEACGLGIAMGNAYEDARKAADWITTDIDDDGIYNAFVHAGVIEQE